MLLVEETVKQDDVKKCCPSVPLFTLGITTSHGSKISETIPDWSLV